MAVAKFRVNWELQGFNGKNHKAGDVLTADVDEVKPLVELGVLTPVTAKEAAAK